MRLIFEKIYDDLFFELIVNEQDIEKMQSGKGPVADFICPIMGKSIINVFLRKEQSMSNLKGKKSK